MRRLIRLRPHTIVGHRPSLVVPPRERPQQIDAPVRPDPSAMYLPRPHKRETAFFRKLGALTECLHGPEVHLGPRDRRWHHLVDRSIADYGRGLCRRIDPNHATEIWVAFLEALDAVDPPAAMSSSRWFEQPWYGIDPLHFFERRLPARESNLAAGFDHARDLGFENVILLADLDEISVLDPALMRARERGLRILGTLDLDRASDTRAAWLSGHDPASPDLLRTAFARLGRDVSSGLYGEHFHHVDRWTRSVDHQPEGAPSSHALVALLKLFLRLASRDQIVLADYACAGAAVSTLVGGELPADRGRVSSTESDLVVWESGVEALRKAVTDRDARPLANALETLPRLGHGSALACTLEEEGSARRLAELVDGDGDRIALALACLYALPSIPIVHAGIEIGARGAHLLEQWFSPERKADSHPIRTLRVLNRAFARRSQRPTLQVLDVRDRSVIAWITDEKLFVANLSASPIEARFDRPDALITPLEPVHRAAVKVLEPKGQLAIRLGAHAFGLFSMKAR